MTKTFGHPLKDDYLSQSCARDQTRTDTPLLALPSESSASTNFATRACTDKGAQRYK